MNFKLNRNALELNWLLHNDQHLSEDKGIERRKKKKLNRMKAIKEGLMRTRVMYQSIYI